jgi:hydroxyacylglutathione hydrolase
VFFRQYYLGCLSHASYLIGDEASGRAIVVDPQRDIRQYLDDAAENGLTIERVIETHFHADFVSGHLELRDATGAAISYGPTAVAEYEIDSLSHGERLSLGDVELEIRHTPGHTPESICVVVREHADDETPYGVLTGDTLFIGDVGRPDLLASKGVSADELGGMLYRSLHGQILTLPDETRVFPAHGAGSACGKQLSTETVSTIGEQRRSNYALAPMSEAEFVAQVTADQPAAPPYFPFNASLNRREREALEEHDPPTALDWASLAAHRVSGAVVIDTRDHAEFARGHLRGCLNVGLGGRFAEYSGDVVGPQTSIVLVTEPGTELEAKVRLGRIGFDRVVGYLDRWSDVFVQHPDEIVTSSRLTAIELAGRDVESLQIVDVRNPGETNLGTIPGSVLIPIAQLASRFGELDPHRPTVVCCAGGYRSSLGASVLEAKGFADVSDLLGGFDAWARSGAPITRGANP